LLCLAAAIGAVADKKFTHALADYLKTIFNKTDIDVDTEQLLHQLIHVIEPETTKVKQNERHSSI